MTEICQQWADKEKVEVTIDYITSQGNKLLLTIAAESQAKSGHDMLAFSTWLPARYADQLVWNFLHDAAGRDIEVIVVLNRVDVGDGALIYADLDKFKHLNDRMGHPAGDAQRPRRDDGRLTAAFLVDGVERPRRVVGDADGNWV